MMLSIIIPLLNEAQSLPDVLARLTAARREDVEVIVVDGGSSDDSAAIAKAAGFTVIRAERGRALQMNAGAAAAAGDVLLFLHADTHLPERFGTLIRDALGSGRHVWGRFDVRISGRSWMLLVVARLMNLRSRLTGIATGDQALFVTRAAFQRVGGFPKQPLMEDIELSKRLRRLSPPACLAQPVTTSGRRWESRGVWRTILLMWRLRWRYWRGASPEQLAREYQ